MIECIFKKGILKFAQGQNQDFEFLIDKCPDVTSKNLKES